MIDQNRILNVPPERLRKEVSNIMIATSEQEPCHDETNRSALKIIKTSYLRTVEAGCTSWSTYGSWLDEEHVAIAGKDQNRPIVCEGLLGRNCGYLIYRKFSYWIYLCWLNYGSRGVSVAPAGVKKSEH